MENHMLKRYFPPAEQQLLISTAGQYTDLTARRDHAWMRAMLHSGLRVKEFSLITVGAAIEALRAKYLFIPRENRKGKKRDHSVFVTQALRTDLQDLLKIRFEITGEGESHLDEALVLSRQHGDGKPMTVRSYELRLKHWATLAGLSDKATPHWLRHTRAMNIMRNSKAADPRGVAQAALDHVSIASTGIYTGVLREEVEDALTEVDAVPRKRVSLSQLRRDFERNAR
jgi:site-specific recombinase XerD